MISEKEIQHLANLARLKLSKKEIDKYRKQISEILDYVGQLKKAKTDEIEPCTGGTELENVLRPDTANQPDSVQKTKILNQAPIRAGDFIKTKGVFEN